MITWGVVLLSGLFYLLGWYASAFWVILLAIANGTLAVVWAVMDPDWYAQRTLSEGVEPNYAMLFGVKAIAIAVLGVAAWHIGTKAGYF